MKSTIEDEVRYVHISWLTMESSTDYSQTDVLSFSALRPCTTNIDGREVRHSKQNSLYIKADMLVLKSIYIYTAELVSLTEDQYIEELDIFLKSQRGSM